MGDIRDFTDQSSVKHVMKTDLKKPCSSVPFDANLTCTEKCSSLLLFVSSPVKSTAPCLEFDYGLDCGADYMNCSESYFREGCPLACGIKPRCPGRVNVTVRVTTT